MENGVMHVVSIFIKTI